MQLKVYKDYRELSEKTAGIIIDLIKSKPDAVICLASGDSPRLTCQIVAERGIKEQIDFSKFTFIGLDEWVGMPPANEGSCHYFFETLLVNPLQLSLSQVHLFDALSKDLLEECKKLDTVIAEKGGIDLMIVGIGMNGHIGFNEPGVSFDNYSHVIDLDETTITVGQKYFKDAVTLEKGITLGLKHLMNSKKAIVIANGNKKAPVIKQAVQGPVSNLFPASIIQQHEDGYVMIDEEAASLINK